MIKILPEAPKRILFAPPGTEAQIKQVEQIVSTLHQSSVLPWQDLGFTKSAPIVTSRSGLYTVVFEEVEGLIDSLDEIGIGILFDVAIIQNAGAGLIANLAPANLDFLQVSVGTEVYNGRIDIQLMGESRLITGVLL